MKPLIGITVNFDPLYDFGRGINMGNIGGHWDYISGDYIYAVERAGGVPVLLPRTLDTETLHPMIDRLDGILVSGGCDLNPALWNERVSAASGRVIPERDDYDLDVLRYAYAQGKPLLCICRGMQVMNVAFGGSMIQDLPSDGQLQHNILNTPRQIPVHSVTVTDPDSILYRVFGGTIATNSFHHQAVRESKAPVRVTAVSEDGIVEGIEVSGGHPFTVGVQWHPEKMFDSEIQLKLFQAFIEACG